MEGRSSRVGVADAKKSLSELRSLLVGCNAGAALTGWSPRHMVKRR